MSPLVPFIWVSGVVHLVVAAANLVLPGILRYRANLAKVAPLIRQIFIVHSAFIVMNLLAFAVLCFFFAPDLAGESLLGLALSAYMAAFWVIRLLVQLFYYDREIKNQHPFAHVAFALAFAYMAGISSAAALGVVK